MMKARFHSRGARLGLIAIALLLTAGGVFTVRERSGLQRIRAAQDDLLLEVSSASWFEHEMDHGTVFPVPASMLEGMPPNDVHRLNLELSMMNLGRAAKTFAIGELALRSSEGNTWPASSGEREEVQLASRQVVHLIVDFDVEESDRGDLRLVWSRKGTSIEMSAIPHHAERDDDQEWPSDSAALPAGDPERGAVIYEKKSACWSCHGKMDRPGSETIGPHLGKIGARASRQHLYESLLEPDRAIATDCPRGPCATPSAMPPWGALLTKQEMADLVAYLLDQIE
jgi:mono/diheme cytochrome c family protein